MVVAGGRNGGVGGVSYRGHHDNNNGLTSSASGVSPPLKSSSDMPDSGSSCDAHGAT
jgi:hypothetical protein